MKIAGSWYMHTSVKFLSYVLNFIMQYGADDELLTSLHQAIQPLLLIPKMKKKNDTTP